MDLILLVEGAWVWIWIKSKTSERALLYIASISTSFFVATQISPWFTSRFLTSHNTFMWLLDQMNQSTHPVGVATELLPPMPASIGLSGRAQWIAIHVVQGLFTVLMAAAIFVLFVVTEYLMTAIWDDDDGWQETRGRAIRHICGAAGACAAIAATIWFVAGLSWFPPFRGIAENDKSSLLLVMFHRSLQFIWLVKAML